jgi:secreted trypsin-like serine protease
MRAWRAALVGMALAAGAGCEGVAPEELVDSRSHAIKNGAPATSANFFGAVAVLDGDGIQYCSGSLVSATCVVTAAHCVVLQDDATGEVVAELGPANLRVAAGALEVASVPPERAIRVRKVVRHPGFAAPGTARPAGLARADDIALLLLEEPIRTMHPVPLAAPDEFETLLDEGTPIVIAGYGARDEYGQASGTLFFGETPFRERNETEFWAGAPSAPDACVGDSGGPAALLVGGDPRLLGIGVRAFRSPGGPECGEGGVYTLVATYRSWLEENADGELSAAADDAPRGCSVGGPLRGSNHPGAARLGALVAGALVALARAKRRPGSGAIPSPLK